MIHRGGKEIPYIYLFLYKLMREKAGNPIFIHYACVREILNRNLHNVPKKCHYIILKEMEELKLIKKIENTPNLKYEFVGRDAEKLLNSYNPVF